MLKISEIYNEVAIDDAAKDSNGNLSHEKFSRYSWRASIRLMDWLTGSIKGEAPPPPLNQKNRDFLSPFLKSYSVSVYGGSVVRPADYYTYDNMYLLRAEPECDVDEDEPVKIVKQPIEILSNDKFSQRIATWIDELKPTLEAPIAKLSDTGFEFYPADIGNIQLQYFRLPAHAAIVSALDPVYHNEIVDESLSINYDFPEAVRNHLIWFIVQQFTLNVKDRSLVELNTLSKP